MGHKNSMNVATAFGVVLYEILRGWGALRGIPGFTMGDGDQNPAIAPMGGGDSTTDSTATSGSVPRSR